MITTEPGNIGLPIFTRYQATAIYQANALPGEETSYEHIRGLVCQTIATDTGLTVAEVMAHLYEHSHLPMQLDVVWACITFEYTYTPAYLKN